MQYLHSLKKIADELDQNGFHHQADKVDYYLRKFAQNAPAVAPADPVPEAPAAPAAAMPPPAPVAPMKPEGPTKQEIQDKMARTIYMMFKELRDLYVQYLPDFDYLGKEHIKIIQSSFDHFLTLYRTVLRDKSADYNNETLQDYRGHLKNIEQELERSMKMKVTPAKVKIDKFYLYGELESLVSRLQRLYDNGKFAELNPVVKRARGLRDAFGNVVKQVSEEIANADLIDIS